MVPYLYYSIDYIYIHIIDCESYLYNKIYNTILHHA